MFNHNYLRDLSNSYHWLYFFKMIWYSIFDYMGLNYSGTKSSNLSCTRDTIHHFANFGTNFFYATFLSVSPLSKSV